MIQGSPEWLQARCGRVTASRVAAVAGKTQSGGYRAERANLMADLVVERMTGKPTEGFQTAAMTRGIELEPMARNAYSARTGHLVVQCGFVEHPSIPMSGASPDGLIDDDMVVELKVPLPATHMDYCLSRKVPANYFDQIQWQLCCTGRSKADFVSFCDTLPEKLQLLIIPVPRDQKRIDVLEAEVRKFLAELEEKIKALEELSL